MSDSNDDEMMMFSEDDEELSFLDEDQEDDDSGIVPWKIIIADDEEEVHKVTKMVLQEISFKNRPIETVDAYSGEETKKVLQEHPDAAMILLDVVMESDDSGLKVAEYIRNELKNHLIRIILRTGQPGKAPERDVILNYDINDYKEKTELTSQKLFTSIISSLRSYRDLHIIESSRRGLGQVIESSAFFFDNQSLRNFSEGVLTQLLSLMGLDTNSFYVRKDGFTATEGPDGFYLLAGTGKYANSVEKIMTSEIPQKAQDYIQQTLKEEKTLFFDDAFVGYFPTKSGAKNILFVNGPLDLDSIDMDLISVFCTNVAVVFENIYLNIDIVATQKDMILRMGDVVENRSKETANHVYRVAEFAYILGKELGLDDEEAAVLRHASPMHDVGKIGIPESILLKPAKLTKDEFEIMKTHAEIGYNIFKDSKRSIVKAAATISHEHHEKWDGSGYPRGLKGDDIHIYGRISAVADVFDALLHKRSYKEAWAVEDVMEYIKKESGKHFDPKVVDALMKNLDLLLAVNEEYPD